MDFRFLVGYLLDNHIFASTKTPLPTLTLQPLEISNVDKFDTRIRAILYSSHMMII